MSFSIKFATTNSSLIFIINDNNIYNKKINEKIIESSGDGPNILIVYILLIISATLFIIWASITYCRCKKILSNLFLKIIYNKFF